MRNFTKLKGIKMIDIQMLENDDTIKASDFCRQLAIDYVGQSDSFSTTSPFGGSRINRIRWMKASEVCPFWIGKTVGSFNRALTNGQHYSHSPYEFVRGNIPLSHQE